MDIEKQLDRINKKLHSYNYQNSPEELYEPIRYLLSIGGKRLRPLLTLFGCYLFTGCTDKALMPSLGIELFHNFTLIHDDIMDKAPLRRGNETVHKKWSQNVAILSGDTMLFKVYDQLIQVDDHLIRKIIKLFNKCAIEVCEGQQLDMNFENRDSVSEEEYLTMIHAKTATLIGFSLKLGALIGGAEDQDAEYLKNFGENIGMGFQLKDDLLDVYANTKHFGKQQGGDIMANKKTYLLIRALNLADEEQREQLDFWLNDERRTAEKVKGVTEIYNQIGIRELTEQKIAHYFQSGLENLASVECSEKRKRELSDFSTSLIRRNH
jgi:geranylgeranyl diphosphate synthase type II